MKLNLKRKFIGNTRQLLGIGEMKKAIIHILIFAMFILAHSFSHGQNNFEEVVYLKNGSIIKGIIIEQVPNQSIKIQTKDGNIFVFKYEEIEKITKEFILINKSDKKSKLTEFKKSGFINITEINYCHGVGRVRFGGYTSQNNLYSMGIRTVNGYQVNEHLALGISIGVDKYKNTALLPIGFDVRVSIKKGKVSPQLSANFGYAIGLNGVTGGLAFNPQIGIKTYVSKNVAHILSVGYKLQERETTYFDGYDIYNGVYTPRLLTESFYFQFLTVSTGFSF